MAPAAPGPVSPDLPAALRDVARLGGFFDLTVGPAGDTGDTETDDGGRWRPVAAFVGTDLDGRIDQVAEQLGGVPRRIAASLLSLSVSARITSVLLGAAGLHGVVPRLHDRLRWHAWSGGPMPLRLEAPEAATPDGGPADDDPADTAGAVADELARTLTPVLDAVRVQASVSPQVLWGNVASSLGGAARMLLTERPTAARPVLRVAVALTEREPLAGLGSFVREPAHPTGVGFARRTCCLYYRVPGGGTCGDCVLTGAR